MQQPQKLAARDAAPLHPPRTTLFRRSRLEPPASPPPPSPLQALHPSHPARQSSTAATNHGVLLLQRVSAWRAPQLKLSFLKSLGLSCTACLAAPQRCLFQAACCITVFHPFCHPASSNSRLLSAFFSLVLVVVLNLPYIS
jgi:hypothetical protein